ncbi:endonuclease domain-containing protein [Streptomyces sp. NRRL F-2580]|uniref:endonuclease domain-containing protein n=1 Tax=Streptomyces sp. NRRL F-2580 TaxID=1463841 RepID=UPI00099B6ACC
MGNFGSQGKGRGHSSRCRECIGWKAKERRFGITKSQFQQLLSFQGGGCGICGSGESRGRGVFHIDHNHDCCGEVSRTCGECVRGLLCAPCNLQLLPGYERLPESLQLHPAINSYLTDPPVSQFRRIEKSFWKVTVTA